MSFARSARPMTCLHLACYAASLPERRRLRHYRACRVVFWVSPIPKSRILLRSNFTAGVFPYPYMCLKSTSALASVLTFAFVLAVHHAFALVCHLHIIITAKAGMQAIVVCRLINTGVLAGTDVVLKVRSLTRSAKWWTLLLRIDQY